MGAELDEYVENLVVTRKALGGLSSVLSATDKYLVAMNYFVGRLRDAIDEAKDLDDFAGKLKAGISILRFFPATKNLARLADTVVGKAQDRASDFFDELVKLDKTIAKYQDAIFVAQKTIFLANSALANDKGDLNALTPQIVALQQILESVTNAAPGSVVDIEALIEADVTVRNDVFPADKLQELADASAALALKASQLEALFAIFDVVASAFEAVLDKLSFMEGPISTLVDALSGFFWVLDKIASIIDAILSPIVDPIFDALGIDKLFDSIAEFVTDLLPDLSELNPLANIGDLLVDFFGAVPDPSGEWELPFITELLRIKDEVFGQFLGEADYIIPFSAPRTNGDDIVIGRYQPDGFEDATVPFSGVEYDGGGGNDIFIGWRGDDTLKGGPGNDFFVATEGDDIIDGGAGNQDVFATVNPFGSYSFTFEERETVDSSGRTITILVMHLSFLGSEEVKPSEYEITNVEFFMFDGVTYGLQDLAGAQTAPPGGGILRGTDRDDVLIGSNGPDTIFAKAGNDRIIPLGSRDTISGGPGSDTVDYAAGGSGRFVAVLDKNHPAYANATDVLTGIENVIAGNGDDTLLGNGAANQLTGGGGNDYLFGFASADQLLGGVGNDLLSGGRANDTLAGGAGLDQYLAGKGFDQYIDGDDKNILQFDQIIYGRGHYDWFNPGDNPLLQDVPSELMDTYRTLESTLFTDQPDKIEVRVTADGAQRVDKFFGSTKETDALIGRFTILATDASERFQLRNETDIIDGGGGGDLFVGVRPDLDAIPDTFGSPLLLGSDGGDTLASSSGDENFVGGNGADLVKLSLSRDTDYAPDTENGPRTRYLVGGESPGFQLVDGEWEPAPTFVNPLGPRDTSVDTLDLSQSDLYWQFNYANNNQTDYVEVLTAIRPGRILPADSLDRFLTSGFERIIGSNQDDIIRNVTGELEFTGNNGDDEVYAFPVRTGNMKIDLGNGDDIVQTGLGVDSVFGGNGDDALYVLANTIGGREFAAGGRGNDVISVVYQANQFAGVTLSGSVDLFGGDGNDLLAVQGDGLFNGVNPVVDLVQGTVTAGNVTATFKSVEAVITFEDDTTIIGDRHGNIISGGFGNDSVVGGAGNDILFGGANQNRTEIDSGRLIIAGRDTIEGGFGNDIVYVGDGGDTDAKGGEGFDVLRFSGRLQWSTESGPIIRFDPAQQRWRLDLETGTGERFLDTVVRGDITFSEFEAVIGGTGDDFISAASAGSDISGSDGDDTLLGGDGDDTLNGGRGNDLVVGAGGDDTLTPFSGDDTVSGGAGLDVLDLRSGSQSIKIDSGSGRAFFRFNDVSPLIDIVEPSEYASQVTFDGVEHFRLSAEGDSFLGSATDETVRGNEGNDTIEGGGGRDILIGGIGNDKLIGDGGTKRTSLDMFVLNDDPVRADVLFAPSPVTMPTTALTIEMLIDVDPVEREYVLMSYAVPGSTNEFAIFNNAADGILRIIINGTVLDTDIQTHELFDGQLHRLSITWSAGGDLIVYVDGEEQFSQATSGNTAAAILSGGFLMFGQDQDGSTPGLNASLDPNQALVGEIGDIRIFNAVLDEATIATQAFRALSSPGTNPALVHYWQADAENNQAVTQRGAQLQTFGSIGFADGGLGENRGDRAEGGAGNDTLDGGVGNDTLNGDEGEDKVFGGDDADTINGGKGDDTLSGGNGMDTLDGGSEDDKLYGGSGNDEIRGSAGNDTVAAGAGDDFVNGGSGDDSIEGGRDNDSLNGWIGKDTIDGGNGDDLLNGDANDDSLSGEGGRDTVNGGTGDDTLSGGAGRDLLSGGAQNDDLAGGTEDDTLSGGAGDDSVNGGAGNDILMGGDGRDTLDGEDGNDIIFGGEERDLIEGGLGSDILDGGDGNDIISGGAAKDRIVGGRGQDRATGGSEEDVFAYQSGEKGFTITDFTRLEDQLELSSNLWSGVRTADDVVADFATQAGSSVVLDFGGGDIVTLEQVFKTTWLADHIVIV